MVQESAMASKHFCVQINNAKKRKKSYNKTIMSKKRHKKMLNRSLSLNHRTLLIWTWDWGKWLTIHNQEIIWKLFTRYKYKHFSLSPYYQTPKNHFGFSHNQNLEININFVRLPILLQIYDTVLVLLWHCHTVMVSLAQ